MMDAFDPVKAAKVVGLPKELRNMGIDKDAILNKEPEAERPIPRAPQEAPRQVFSQPSADSEKMRSEIRAQQAKIAELESRMSNMVEKVNLALNSFNDRLENMRQSQRSRPQETPPPKQEAKQQTLGKTSQERAAGKEKLEPGDIAIEDYFNFSNAKFK